MEVKVLPSPMERIALALERIAEALEAQAYGDDGQHGQDEPTGYATLDD